MAYFWQARPPETFYFAKSGQDLGKKVEYRVGLSLMSLDEYFTRLKVETMKMAPRQDQSCGLESWLQFKETC